MFPNMDEGKIDLTCTISNYLCPVCQANGIDIQMEQIGNHYVCPICRSSSDCGEVDFKNLVMKIRKHFDNNRYFLNFLPSPHPDYAYLNLILFEIRDSILCGSYMSALATLGVYLELLVKEIYFVHNGSRLRCELGPAIMAIKNLLKDNEVEELTRLKNTLRNPVVHGNISELLSESYIKETIPDMPVRHISDLQQLLKEDDFSYYICAADIPDIAFCVTYKSYFREKAIQSFYDVYNLASVLCDRLLTIPNNTKHSTIKRYTKDEFEKLCLENNKEYEILNTEKHIVTTRDWLKSLLESSNKNE